MENENVIGKVCFAILRKGFVAGLRISLELDSPGCIIGCKFDGAGIVGNTVIDVAEIDNYEVYALTWDDVFQSFDLRHAFLLDKLKMDKEAIAAEIAQTAGDEKSKDTADALTALVAN